VAGLTFREGRATDLPAGFALAQHAMHDTALRHGWLADGARAPGEAEVRGRWLRQRPLVEFLAAQAGAGLWVCEDGDELVGFAQVARFGAVEVLTDLMVAPSHHRRGVGRDLLARLWPLPPAPERGRVVVATGAPADLSLYTGFGAMPVAGHWLLRQRSEAYLERRTRETVDGAEPAVHALEARRAVEAWQRLEPGALGHDRPLLHEFFGRTRTCLASVDARSGRPTALCWVSSDGEIGPAVGEGPQDLVAVVLACLDRVAKIQEPELLGVYCTSASWSLLRRLRRLGFRVLWPGWVLASGPLPGLERYMPTTPPRLL
jgi:GNAT superfamily N-acetyltransferase